MSHGETPNGLNHHARSQAPLLNLPNVPGLGGAIAGFGGGLAMIVIAAMLSVATGGDVWREPREIAAPLVGIDSPIGVAVGTVLHFLTAGLLGGVFGIVKRRALRLPSDYGVPVLAGLIYGLMIWFVAYFLVLPVLNPALLDTYAPSFVIQHMVYGVVTGLIYSVLRPAPYARQQGDRTILAGAD